VPGPTRPKARLSSGEVALRTPPRSSSATNRRPGRERDFSGRAAAATAVDGFGALDGFDGFDGLVADGAGQGGQVDDNRRPPHRPFLCGRSAAPAAPSGERRRLAPVVSHPFGTTIVSAWRRHSRPW
jgi:hypothetical protein